VKQAAQTRIGAAFNGTARPTVTRQPPVIHVNTRRRGTHSIGATSFDVEDIMATHPIQIRKFELDVRLVDGAERSYDFENDSDCTYASLTTREALGKRQQWHDADSAAAVGQMLDEIAPAPRMSEYELLERARAALHMDDSNIQRLDVDVRFADGSEIEAESVKRFRDSWIRHAELNGLP